MRNIYILVIALLLTVNSWAQAPQKMSYQAVIRNSSNALVTSSPIGMQISILQGSATGSAVYTETLTTNTNTNGLVSIVIGNGTAVTGTFSTINWTNGPYFIKTETDPTGGTAYTISGTSELLSVPYALHAKTAESISGGITETDPVFGTSVASSITTTDINNWNNKLSTETDPVFVTSPANGISSSDINNWNNKLSSEVDGSVTNELQSLSISNDTVYLSNGGYAKLPAGFNGDYNSLTNKPTAVSSFSNDAGYLTSFTEIDGSATNELQTLKISNDTIYLTNGGFAKLPAGFNGDYNSLTNKPTAVSSFSNDAGYLTSFTEVDGSLTNELQTLRISNDTIYLSNGGFAKLPATNAWGLNGNAATSTNFIGTTNGNPLNFKVSNQKAGKIDINTASVFFGAWAGNSSTGNDNNAIGQSAFYSNTTGTGNSVFGDEALANSTTGNRNTAIGQYAMGLKAGGDNNTAIGYNALQSSSSGSNNTGIGAEAGSGNTGSSNIFIGNQAGLNSSGSNKLYIANSSATPLIYGDFATKKLGINTNTPNATLDLGVTSPSNNPTLLLYNNDPSGPYAGTKVGFYGDQFSLQNNATFVFPTLPLYPGSFIIASKSTNTTTLIPRLTVLGESGNVGIGTSSPTTKLEVAGNAKFGATGQINIWEWDNIEKIGIDYNTVNGDFNMRNPIAGKRLLGTISTTGSWGVETTTGTELVRITGAGNMGIGNTSPTAKLQVETYGFSNKTIWGMNSMLIQNQTPGSRTLLALAPNGTQNADFVIYHNSDYTTNTEALSLGYENTLNNFIIGTSKTGTGSARRLVIDATGASSNLWKQLVLATNGNVGIGTLTPSAALEVNGAIKVTGGTASQFLKADGSLDNNTYLTSIIEVADEFSATTAQTSFTLTQTPSTNSKVKMYINGVRISNTAYSVSGTTLTYVPANNGSYSLSVNDRIQFDYSY